MRAEPYMDMVVVVGVMAKEEQEEVEKEQKMKLRKIQNKNKKSWRKEQPLTLISALNLINAKRQELAALLFLKPPEQMLPTPIRFVSPLDLQ